MPGETQSSSIYTPLDPAQQQIRVLRIQPSKDEEGRVVGQLELVSLSGTQQASYEAWSWSWGDPDDKRVILLNEQPFAVPTNAVELLEAIHTTERHKCVWLDAVCINQNDWDERANQVSFMHKVYSCASRVLVWFGPDTEGLAEQAFASFEMLRTHFETNTEQYASQRYNVFRKEGSRPEPSSSSTQALPSCNWEAVENFFSVPWFSRIWVCQEVMLNKNVLCVRGIHELPWDVVGLAARWLEHCHYERPKYVGKVLTYLHAGSQLWEFSYALPPDWSNLLALSSIRKAKEPVDHVYALLGVAQKTSASNAINVEANLKPDCTKDLRLVFAAATRVAIQMRCNYSNALNILWLARIRVPPIVTSDTVLEPDDDDWPSWVPRYHWTLDTSKGSPDPMNDWHGDNAMRNSRILQMGTYGSSPLVLCIKGLIVSKVQTTGFVLAPNFILKNDEHLSEQILFLRQWSHDKGIPERDFAMTLTSRKTQLDFDAATDEHFYSQYETFISECQPENASRRWTPEAQAYKTAIFCGSVNRMFFITSDGRFGMGHPRMRPGDYVCLLFCGITPFVLRREKGHWRLVGAAYIHDLMHGEYIEQWAKQPRHDSEIVTFDIH